MPGLEMPARGGGAAMLRELRDEERPPLEERPALQEGGNAQANQSYDNMTDNMTNKPTDNQTEQKADNPSEQKSGSKSNKTARNKTTKPGSQEAAPKENREAAPKEGLSVAEMIRRRTAQRGEQEVLKTVTLKLSPSLDEKVERYCFDNKMKKQEFWAEAAALYFETIAGGNAE